MRETKKKKIEGFKLHNEVVISFSFVLVFVTELRLVSKYLKMQESVGES